MRDKIAGGTILLTLLSLYVWALRLAYPHPLWVIVIAVATALLVSVVVTKLIITAINLLSK